MNYGVKLEQAGLMLKAGKFFRALGRRFGPAALSRTRQSAQIRV